METKTYISIGILIIFLATCFLLIKIHKNDATIKTTNPEGGVGASNQDKNLNDNKDTVYLEWIITDLPSGKDGQPWENISLKLTGVVQKEIFLGKFSACSPPDPDEQENAPGNLVATLYCKWGGRGDKFTVEWDTPEELTIYHENSGPTKSGEPELTLLKTVPVPRGVIVEMKDQEE